jgi:hypothetical protein
MMVHRHQRIKTLSMHNQMQRDSGANRPTAFEKLANAAYPDDVRGPDLVPTQTVGRRQQGAVVDAHRDMTGYAVVVSFPR